MKKLLALVLALTVALGCTSALAAGKLTVNQESYWALNVYDNYRSYIYAELENTGDKNIEFESGILEILDADGEPVASEEIYSMYPEVLAPGEKGYVYTYKAVNDATSLEQISDYTLNVLGKSTKKEAPVYLTANAVYEIRKNKWDSDEPTVVVNLKNEHDATATDVRVVIGVYDEEGKLIYSEYTTCYSIGIPAGQQIEVLFDISSTYVEAWAAENRVPTTAEVIAYID